jgi:2',3'-cyclic-nucleotide 2'-phosphodiesterase (5'-nucleotidase family)
LRAGHPKFVFVAGGHDHEPEFSQLSDDAAAVMKGASNARAIWTIDMVFDDKGLPVIVTNKLNLDATVPVDPDYRVLEDKWRGRLLDTFPFLEARVGAAALVLDAREVAVRSVESGWGNFIVDQMRTAFGEPAADLAFINGGTLRIDDMIEDDIRFEDIGRTFGYSSFLRHTSVSGAEFRQIMEAGYRGSGGTQGYFPQISGFRICVDRSRNEGDRIVSLQVPADGEWQDIKADKSYDLVVPDFIYGGGDGYQIPKDRPVSRPGSELKYLVLDAVLAAQAQGLGVGVAIDLENRRFHELYKGNKTCFQ